MRRLFVLLPLLTIAPLPADEGMWLLNQPPKARIQKKYGFNLTQAFMDRLRLGSVRMNNGGSASFVSPNGLIFTNHHVASECIQQLSSAGHDYMNNGFLAESLAAEKACPSLEINILLEIADVTPRVRSEVPESTPAAEANQKRKAVLTAIEKECTEKSGNRCDVVTLYKGGQYHLYRYRKYTDIRLVFAPEVSIAAFGGDPDNFTYPRYCLDFAFLRAYENGKPASTPDYLRWSKTGARDKELTFVTGHPGSTGRLETQAALEFLRDKQYPYLLRYIDATIRTLLAYSAANAEQKREAQDDVISQQNSFKAYTGFLAGLRDADLMARKKDEEQTLRARGGPALEASLSRIAAAYRIYREFDRELNLFERAPARASALLPIAIDVVRYGTEKAKPNDTRLREYVDPALPSLEQAMYSTAPVVASKEIAVLASYFRVIAAELGAENPVLRQILDGRSPEEAARRIMESTRLADVAERKRLASDPAAVAASADGMVRLARILDTEGRKHRKRYEDEVEGVLTAEAVTLEKTRFSITGTDDYPDATFTLRLAYGPVAGYRNAEGKAIPWATDFRGLYGRATGQDPFTLPPSWIKAKEKVRMSTPFNFVTTNDTHGGNSGSPTLNTRGEVIGILFDGNIEGLPNRFVYRDSRERSVHVASQGIAEALRSVYGAHQLLKELGVEK